MVVQNSRNNEQILSLRNTHIIILDIRITVRIKAVVKPVVKKRQSPVGQDLHFPL